MMFRFQAKTLLMLLVLSSGSGYPDFFNYDQTNRADDTYGPADWGQVDCLNVANCPGWPTNWGEITDFIPYNENISNMCKDCSESNQGPCATNMQSPINLQRKTTAERECYDRHLMRYWAGQCRFQDMRFEILPHRLRVYRPDQDCTGVSQPQLDFSKGFPVPWLLSFTDISVPSQHTIEGKYFDAEVVLSHTYSVKQKNRLIGNLAIMLQKGLPADRYDFLDLHIQGWVKEADASFQHCFPKKARQLSAELQLAIETFNDADAVAYVTSRNLQDNYPIHDPRFQHDSSKPEPISIGNYKRAWHPYDWYVKANTEYYFRYQGSMAEPPCIEIAHWRVVKDPVKVAPAQLLILQHLLLNRLDRETCKYNTAGKVDTDSIAVNRPLQMNTPNHQLVFCECIDWTSKSAKDIAYCKLSEKERGVFRFVG